MSRWIRPLVFLLPLLAGAAPAQDQKGRQLVVVEPVLTKAKVDVYKTSEIEIALQLTRIMPATGWVLEATGGEDEGDRAVLRYFPHPPKEPGPAVDWPIGLRFPLGSPKPGDRVVEILEEGENGATTLVHALVLRVEGPGEELEGGFVAKGPYAQLKPKVEGSGRSGLFSLDAVRKMPSPGWTFSVGDPKLEGNRIVVQVEEVPPAATQPRQATETPVEIFLGDNLPVGRYLVILRGGKEGEDVLQQALLVDVGP